MKILIIKLGALGDVINTLPAVIRLKHHFHAEIHWLVAPLSLPMVLDHPAVDRTIVFDRNEKQGITKTLGILRREQYDLSIDFQRTLKSGFFCMASRSRQRLGFDKKRCKELTWLFPFTRISPGDSGKHMLDQYLDFCDHLKIPESPIEWTMAVHPFSRVALPRPYVVLNIGATKKANLWGTEKFAILADLIQQKLGMTTVITGGPEDVDRGEMVENYATGKVINLTGKTSLRELTGILSHAQGVVSCDTGPMHLAVALGTPTIALFGPSTPRRTGPYAGEVIMASTDCSPCNRRECPHPWCMDRIDPETVYEHITRH
ncbi:MAG: glycosyltransferase family 9 protein [Desulfobacterium sp.]